MNNKIYQTKTVLLLWLIFLGGCNTANDYCKCVNAKDLLSNNSKFTVVSDSAGGIVEIWDRGSDKLRDAEYIFDDKGCLNKFLFFNSDETFSFEETYSSDGHINSKKGTPLVYKSFIEVAGSDSVTCLFYFYSLNKEYERIEVDVNGNTRSIKFIHDTTYANMTLAEFGVNYEKYDSLTIITNFSYVDDCEKKFNLDHDTINFGIKR